MSNKETTDDMPTDEPVLEEITDPNDPFHHSKLINVVSLKHGTPVVGLVPVLAKLHIDTDAEVAFISLYHMPKDVDTLTKLIKVNHASVDNPAFTDVFE